MLYSWNKNYINRISQINNSDSPAYTFSPSGRGSGYGVYNYTMEPPNLFKTTNQVTFIRSGNQTVLNGVGPWVIVKCYPDDSNITSTYAYGISGRTQAQISTTSSRVTIRGYPISENTSGNRYVCSVTKGSFIENVYSINQNEYPQNGISGIYWYKSEVCI